MAPHRSSRGGPGAYIPSPLGRGRRPTFPTLGLIFPPSQPSDLVESLDERSIIGPDAVRRLHSGWPGRLPAVPPETAKEQGQHKVDYEHDDEPYGDDSHSPHRRIVVEGLPDGDDHGD